MSVEFEDPNSESLFGNKKVTKDVKKKVLAEKKAHELVKQLLEKKIDRMFFASSLHFLSIQHYQDVNEERAILKLCGYPLCDNELTKIWKQQYRISSNRVYDLTQRKLFCCDRCYKASEHAKRQISTSPLWLRDPDKVEPVDLDISCRGAKGEEVLLHMRVPRDLDEDASTDSESSSEESDEKDDFSSDLSGQLNVPPTPTDLIPKETNEPPQAVFSSSRDASKNKDLKLNTFDNVSRIFKEWFTEKSLIYLGFHQHPTQKSSNDLSDEKARKIEKFKQLERNLDMVVRGVTYSETSKEAQPTEKEEINDYAERVRLFYQGRMSNTGSVRFKDKEEKKEEENIATSVPFIIPQVDSKNQLSIRRGILHQKLARVAQDLFPILPPAMIARDLKEFISTFNLSSENVILKTNEYPLMMVMVMKVLSEKDEVIRSCFNQSKPLINHVLSAYQLNLFDVQSSVCDVVDSILHNG